MRVPLSSLFRCSMAFALLFPASVALAQISDWKLLGNPVDDDSVAMMDRYVYFDGNTTDKKIALDKPVLSHEEVQEWVKAHAGTIMTLDGTHYDRRIRNYARYFTPRGYADYVMYLEQANMGTFLKDHNLKILAYVDGTPEITESGLTGLPATPPQGGTATAQDEAETGSATQPDRVLTYIWRAQARLVLSYLDYRNQPPSFLFPQKNRATIDNRFPVSVRMEIIRVPMQQDGSVIAINRIRFAKDDEQKNR